MNTLGTFYNELAARLLTIVGEDENPIIKHVDFWNFQITPEGMDTFPFPAVFIELGELPWQSVGKQLQVATLPLTLHVVSTAKYRSEFGGQFAAKFLEHLELISAINYQLSGWNGSVNGSLSRTGFGFDHAHGDVIMHLMPFRCTIKDDSAMRTWTKLEGDKLKITLPL